MSIKSEENIVKLQIAIDDTVFVEILQCQAHLRGVKLCSLRAKLSPLDMKHKVASADVLHNKINPGLGLEASVQIEEERMALFVGDKEHPLFGTSAFDFVILDDELLLEHFDGVQFLRCLRFSEHHFTEIALSEYGEEIEMIKTNATTGALRVCGWRDFVL